MGLLQFVEEKFSPPQMVVLSFLSLILVGTLLLLLPPAVREGNSLAPLDALFTATSAVCVTGLVVVDTGTFFSRFGQVVIMMLIQMGGLGLMAMTTFYWLVFGRRIKLRERLLVQQALNLNSLAGVVRLVRYILLTTLLIEGIGALFLSFWFIPRVGLVRGMFFGLFHGISAFCNAGFDLLGEFQSFTPFPEDLYVNLVLIILILAGGIGFTVLVDIYNFRSFHRLSLHSNVVLTVSGGLLLLGFLAVFLLERQNPATLGALSPGGRLLAAFFQTVTPRTAGFSTIPMDNLRPETQFFLIFLMFVGASPGSTGGGIKTATLGTVLAAVWAVSAGREEIDIFHRRLPYLIVFKSLAIIILGLGMLMTATILLLVVEGAEFLPIFFEAASALGTVGLSTGLTPELSPLGKAIVIITMFIGRVGPLTLAVAIGQKEKPLAVKYPEEKIIVG